MPAHAAQTYPPPNLMSEGLVPHVLLPLRQVYLSASASSHLRTCTTSRLCIRVARTRRHFPSTEMDHVASHQVDKYNPKISSSPQHRLIHILFITLPLLATPSASMVGTRGKNKSAHPGIPDMTPSQCASAGLPPAQTTRRAPNKLRPGKKLSVKDQQIADLQEELRIAQETIVRNFSTLQINHADRVSHQLLEPFS